MFKITKKISSKAECKGEKMKVEIQVKQRQGVTDLPFQMGVPFHYRFRSWTRNCTNISMYI